MSDPPVVGVGMNLRPDNDCVAQAIRRSESDALGMNALSLRPEPVHRLISMYHKPAVLRAGQTGAGLGDGYPQRLSEQQDGDPAHIFTQSGRQTLKSLRLGELHEKRSSCIHKCMLALPGVLQEHLFDGNWHAARLDQQQCSLVCIKLLLG